MLITFVQDKTHIILMLCLDFALWSYICFMIGYLYGSKKMYKIFKGGL